MSCGTLFKPPHLSLKAQYSLPHTLVVWGRTLHTPNRFTHLRLTQLTHTFTHHAHYKTERKAHAQGEETHHSHKGGN